MDVILQNIIKGSISGHYNVALLRAGYQGKNIRTSTEGLRLVFSMTLYRDT